MPQTSSMLRYERSRSTHLPFVRFDGQYPQDWPDAVQLPRGAFLRLKGSLDGKRNKYGFLADFDGVCRGTPDSVAADWQQRITSNGWTCDLSEPDVKQLYPSGMADNYLKLFAEGRGTTGSGSAEIIVYRHSRMDGWVHFGGYVNIDNSYYY